MPIPTQKKTNDAFAYLLSDQSVNAKLVRVASLADFQIGLPEDPAELQVTGRLSVSTLALDVKPGQTVASPDYVTFLAIRISQALQDSQVNLVLPSNPRIGQILYVKDELGNSDSCRIALVHNSANIQIINNKFDCIGLIWSGASWSTLSDSKIINDSPVRASDFQTAIENLSSPSYIVLQASPHLTNERILTAGANISIVDNGPGGKITISSGAGGGGGSGDVVGPASSTTNAIAKYADTTGKLLSNTSVTIDASNNVTVPGRIVVTGGTTSATDATLGNAAVGSFPYYDGGGSSGVYAMFGHKDLDHSTAVTNYALYQDNTGNTAINASSGKTLYFAINNVALGAITNDLLSTGVDAILFTGDLSTRTDVLLGNYTGASATTIYAGTGDLNIGENAASRTVNVGTGNNTSEQEVTIGSTFGRSPLVLRAGTGNMYLTGAIAADFIIGHTAGTGGIAVGRSTASNTINIGNSGDNASNTQTVNIAAGSGRSTVTIGSTVGASSTSVRAGSGGITLSGSGGQTVITGSSTTYTDALIGAWEIGSLPATQGASPNAYAFVGHKDLNHSSDGNYALVQSNVGDTFLGAVSTKDVYFKNGTNVIGQLSNDTVSFTGQTGAAVATTLGNSFGVSYTNINAGTFGITLSGSSTTTITGSTSTSAEAHIGTVELGELPYTRTSLPSYFAMFGHKTLDHSVNGNYALVQSYDGDTFLNAASSKSIYFQNAGNLIGSLNASTISLTGQSSTAVATTLGSSFGVSTTNIYAGLFGITLSGSATTTITGSSSASAEAHIGTVEIGELPFTKTTNPGIYAMFGHKSLDHSVDGNYAIVQSNVGDTFVGAASAKNIYIKIGTSTLGTISSLFTTLSGSAFATLTGNATSINGNNSLSLYAGSGGITLSGSGGQTVITGSSTTYTDATVGAWEIGSLPATQGSFPNVYAFLGHKSLDHSTDGNYALVQSNVGDTFLGAVSTKDIYFKNGTDIVGQLSNDTVSFTGKSGTSTTTTLGNSASTSTTNISAGTGGVFVTGSTTLSAGLFNYPTGSSTTCPLVLLTNEGATVHRWAMGTDTGDDLNFAYAANSTTVLVKGYIDNTTNVGAIDFTGQHRNFPASGSINDYFNSVGLIVVATGQYKNLVSGSSDIFINEALPTVALSTSRNQKSVFGVISDTEDVNEISRDYATGRWISVYEKSPNDDRLIINSLGEGGIWVCNINGVLENGDYITSCEIPGYGMKQDDDILRNYTVAKITCNCDFDLNSSVYRCEEFIHEGTTHRRAFVGCTYHCG